MIVTQYAQDALVEGYIDGREICVALLGNSDLEVLPLVGQDFTGREAHFATWAETPRSICRVQIESKLATILPWRVGRVGVDEHSWPLTVKRWTMLQSLLLNATLVKEPRIIDRLRLIKSPRELEYQRGAARQAKVGMRAGIEAIAPGVKEREVAGAVNSALVNAGSGMPLHAVLTSGEQTNLVQGGPADRQLERGDTVYFELDGIYKNYCGRLMHTAVVDPASAEQQRIPDNHWHPRRSHHVDAAGHIRRRHRPSLPRTAPGIWSAQDIYKPHRRVTRRLWKKQGVAPKRMVTDKLRSYGAVKRQVMAQALLAQGPEQPCGEFPRAAATAVDPGLPITGKPAAVRIDLLGPAQSLRLAPLKTSAPHSHHRLQAMA